MEAANSTAAVAGLTSSNSALKVCFIAKIAADGGFTELVAALDYVGLVPFSQKERSIYRVCSDK
jgi:hypothetical protein